MLQEIPINYRSYLSQCYFYTTHYTVKLKLDIYSLNIQDLSLDLILVLFLSPKYLFYSVNKVKKVFMLKNSIDN